MFNTAHSAGAWNSSQVSQVLIADYMLIYGGVKSGNYDTTPKFYITQNGTAFFDGALITNGSIIGGSLKIGQEVNGTYAF